MLTDQEFLLKLLTRLETIEYRLTQLEKKGNNMAEYNTENNNINVEQAPVENIPEFLRRVDENGNPIPVAVQTPEDTGADDKIVN